MLLLGNLAVRRLPVSTLFPHFIRKMVEIESVLRSCFDSGRTITNKSECLALSEPWSLCVPKWLHTPSYYRKSSESVPQTHADSCLLSLSLAKSISDSKVYEFRWDLPSPVEILRPSSSVHSSLPSGSS